MAIEVLIVGGGLSGLSAAWQLHRNGVDICLVEARTRLGGRILTIRPGAGSFDLGPSWVWPGQPYVANLLEHFAIPVYPQRCDGNLLHQSADGRIHEDAVLSPMAGALRIRGGVGALVDAIAKELPSARIRLETQLRSLTATNAGVTVGLLSNGSEESVEAVHVALALPPRLAAGFRYLPPLPNEAAQSLQATPTWMANHAKFLALYDSPFWRERGLSGDVMSRRGPLAEVHDASPENGAPFALFGFVGLDATTRTALGRASLIDAALSQLVDLFGPTAGRPIETHLQDWSQEEYTASEADRQFSDHHPIYGLSPHLEAPWTDRIHFIGTETASEDGGLIEGALGQAMRFAKRVHGARTDASTSSGVPHVASMDWDWLDQKT